MNRLDCSLSFRFGLAMGSHLPISRSIGQPLANDTTKGALGPLSIVYTKRDPLIIPEIELRKIAVQMPLGAMLIDALHAAFEDGEIAFDGVGVDIAPTVLTTVMANDTAPSRPSSAGVCEGH